MTNNYKMDFFSGLARVLDIGGVYDDDLFAKKDIGQVLREDGFRIRQDLWMAMEKTLKEYKMDSVKNQPMKEYYLSIQNQNKENILKLRIDPNNPAKTVNSLREFMKTRS